MNKPSDFLNTKKFADSIGVEPDTPRRGYQRNGSYLGIKPTKLENGRLLWPADAVAKLADRK